MILDWLKEGVVLGDGGSLFELERRGYVSAGPFTPEVSIEHPEALRHVQIDFARAGAQVLQALTYYAHEEKLQQIGKESAMAEINAAAVQIANEVAREYGCLVAGNLANTWTYDDRTDSTTREKTRRQYDQQIVYQLSGSIDFFIAGTLEYLGEAKIALDSIKGSRKNNLADFALRFGSDSVDPIEQSHRNSKLFRGLCE